MDMYNETAAYAQSLMPPESSLLTFAPRVGAPVHLSMDNARPYAANIQVWLTVEPAR